MKSSFVLAFLVLFLAKNSWAGVSTRIIGGSNARAGQFPFSAAITTRTANTQLFCGGTLWTDRWIITSAQCVVNGLLFTIQLGSAHLTQADANRVTVSSSEYVIHPDFNPETFEHDIGLIKLRLPVQQNEYLNSVNFLPLFALNDNSEVIAMGWGQISDNQAGEVEQLQYVTVTTLSNDECKIAYGDQIKENMVCVEGNYNEGTCTGDIGTPLIEYYSRQATMITGIATFISGNGCESTLPSGYTRVYSYVSWIRNWTTTTV